MSFSHLHLASPIIKAVNQCGYAAPTPIQALAIPKALEGRDLIATAQTGTGKTAAFVLPALHRLNTPSASIGRPKGPRVLVLTPTRELANQVTEAVRTYGKFMPLRVGAILGGMPYFEQLRLLSRPVDLIVATPGRLIDHMENGRINFARLELLVLDEADRMLDMGFSHAVDQIAAATPATRQTLLFTATMDEAMAKLARRMLREPVRVEVTGKQVTLDQIEQRLHAADDMQHKNQMLKRLIADSAMTRAIIFSGTKRNADQLARELSARGHAAAALHGDMNQNQRNRTIMNVRSGKVRLLVATDVAARGLDVPGVTHVINYDLPKFAEDYVHRIGRTGRAGAAGIAISFVSQNDLDSLGRIERYTRQTLRLVEIAGLEPKRSLRRSGESRNNHSRPASSNRRSAAANRRDGRNTSAHGSTLSKSKRKPGKEKGYSTGWGKNVKNDGGKAGDFRSCRSDRQAGLA